VRILRLCARLLLWGAFTGAASGCALDFPDELPYACETNEDCGDTGHICTTLPDSRRYCCLPEPEVCNQVDDNCDAIVDNLSTGSCTNGSP
jgi:hypothetical protein